MTADASIFIGLMSGTSLDGVNAVAVKLLPHFSLLATSFLPIDPALRKDLLALQQSGYDEIHRSALAANRLTHLYAQACQEVIAQAGLKKDQIRAIGCHGQTIRHRPDQGYTLQINNPALLAELTGITVIADFRSRDIAAGGQGAPLVPAFHASLFSAPDEARAILNLGGMANLTYLPPINRIDEPIYGFDTGPANVLLDSWSEHHRGLHYDQGGQWAASGQCIPELLQQLLGHPFFARRPPKSCGRDDFNLDWLLQQLAIVGDTVQPQDVQATLLELTARSNSDALRQYLPRLPRSLYLCGGGTHNLTLIERLQEMNPEINITTTQTLGLPVDWVEASAFAWLAQQTLDCRPGNLASVTGAQGPRLLGAIYSASHK